MSKELTLAILAKSGSEEGHQRAVMQWAALNMTKYPELRWLHHVPNGATLGSTKEDRMIRGAKMKAMGMKKGVFDLCLPVKKGDHSGLYLEMKKPGEKIKKDSEQEEFGKFVRTQGFIAMEADNYELAIKILETYLTL